MERRWRGAQSDNNTTCNSHGLWIKGPGQLHFRKNVEKYHLHIFVSVTLQCNIIYINLQRKAITQMNILNVPTDTNKIINKYSQSQLLHQKTICQFYLYFRMCFVSVTVMLIMQYNIIQQQHYQTHNQYIWKIEIPNNNIPHTAVFL